MKERKKERKKKKNQKIKKKNQKKKNQKKKNEILFVCWVAGFCSLVSSERK
jgi:phosphate/sulfate permease